MSQQMPLTAAPDSAALVVSANVLKYAIKKKKVLTPEEAALHELTQAAGIIIDQEVFKFILDLLEIKVAPQAIFPTLKAMCAGQRVAKCGTDSSSAAHTTNTAPTEARVRTKTGVSNSEKSRKPTTQRVQRQQCANRGQKTKRLGSSSSSSQINST